VTSHEAALWWQKRTEGDDWRTTLRITGSPAHMVAPAVDNIQTTAAVGVRKRHFARAVAASVCDVIIECDVTAHESVNGGEVDVLLGVCRVVGVSKTHRFATRSRTGASQYGGATGSGHLTAGTL